MRSDHTYNALWFVAGLSLGVGLGMVFAPASGAATRRYLGERAGSARDYIGRGRELYDKGRELADEAAQLYEDGRHLVEDSPL
jgi:hypothetical protein